MTQERLKELFEYRDGYFINRSYRSSNSPAGAICRGTKVVPGGRTKRYGQISIDDERYLIHRMIFLWHHGYLPACIDHIDRNRENNRIENLREATPELNQWNIGVKAHSVSRTKGVQWRAHANAYAARLTRNGRRYFLGYFKDIGAASAAVANKEAEFLCVTG